MKKISVLMIGAGETGTPLLRQLLDAPFVEVYAVADLDLALSGIALARERQIAVSNDFEALVRAQPAVDVIIDVTGAPVVRERLRTLMQESGNAHTVIVHERVALLMMSLGAGQLVQSMHAETGY
ncbi:oxidoreductase [Craterilacuibacter sinensis]|uniref:Oxidoreductase n=1 Tax=Craterilacuibacter sinensis TaxID=2686017 RepID=A0A845BT82_9NEIS|nr:oxidoreductase [Craterilacuibacter sinensis]MXR37376.1 oxidoreductase [Craterilacuibacter sinensis]